KYYAQATFLSILDRYKSIGKPPTSLYPERGTKTMSQTQKAMNLDRSKYWEQKAGLPLSILLQKAGHGSEARKAFMRFFLTHITDTLGPLCNKDDTTYWKSFMTDDHTPIEFSWQWNIAGAPPTIRYSIEAICPLAGTSADPFNVQGQRCLIEKLQVTLHSIDLAWYNHFATRLLPAQNVPTPTNPSTTDSTDASFSTCFMGFDLARSGDIATKAYFIPSIRANELGMSNLDLVFLAISELPGAPMKISPSLNTLLKFIKAEESNLHLRCEMLGIDCTSPESARLKIYMRSRSMSFDAVKLVMTLGGCLETEGSKTALCGLFELWQLLFSTNDDACLDSQTSLPYSEHRTAGILYYFDISRNGDICIPKVYLPVRHYASSDDQVLEMLCSFMSKRGKHDAARNYGEALRDI
ncbi:MAG: hypothetical protein Q9174_007321, partial [Haloplaca sp. 1 TL-2023]